MLAKLGDGISLKSFLRPTVTGIKICLYLFFAVTPIRFFKLGSLSCNMINIIFVFVEAEIRKNAELTTLAEEFRLYANELVDMLDGRVPFVSRFKVRIRCIHVREVGL